MELIHTCYRITDPERSIAFYEALGLEKRREGRRLVLEGRPEPQGGAEIEAGDDDCGDHGNVCSTRTRVPLSTWH